MQGHRGGKFSSLAMPLADAILALPDAQLKRLEYLSALQCSSAQLAYPRGCL